MTESSSSSPHEFKALLLFVLILFVVAFAGGFAYLRYSVRTSPYENGVTYPADGSMIVTADGQQVRIRVRSGIVMITPLYDPNFVTFLRNVRDATLSEEIAERYGLSKLDVSALKQISTTVTTEFSQSQRDIIATAYSLYVKAGGIPASAAARPATSTSAPASRPLAGPAESALLEAVAGLNDDPKFVPPWRRVDRVRQILSAEQFDKIAGKNQTSAATAPAAFTRPAPRPATTTSSSTATSTK